MSGPFRIERLGPAHDRASFSCGVVELDRYLREFAGQDMRKRFSNCFVAVANDAGGVAGFYTLSATAVSVRDIPEDILKRLPRYPLVPAALVGRLAVDARHRGRRLGEALLFDAAARTLRADPAAFALVVEAKDEAAAAFYRRYEFQRLGDGGLRFMLAASSLADRFRRDAGP